MSDSSIQSTATTQSSPKALRTEIALLFSLAWPIALAQVGANAMSLIDTAIIGRVSVVDLAGAGLGRVIGFAAFSGGIGLVAALEALASQAVGAGEHPRAWRALTTTLKASMLIWIPAVLLSFATTLLLPAFGVEAEVVQRARAYLLGQAPGMIFMVAFAAGKTFLQAHGRTRPALIASIAANVLNVIVCNLLVRGDDALAAVHLPAVGLPRLGAFGAGLASSIASLLLAAIVLVAAREFRDERACDPIPTRTILRLGVPAGLQILAEIAVYVVISMIVGSLGATVTSAHQIALNVTNLAFVTALGVSSATAVGVGRAIGAGASPRRVGLLGIGLGASLMVICASILALFPRALAGLFIDDPAVIAICMQLLVIASVFQLFDGIQAVAGGALNGAGDVRFAFLASLACHWLVGFPIALFLGFAMKLGVTGMWWGLTAGLITVSVVLSARFVWLSSKPIKRV